jgi:tetratricopeptide (TPR) repeat protein
VPWKRSENGSSEEELERGRYDHRRPYRYRYRYWGPRDASRVPSVTSEAHITKRFHHRACCDYVIAQFVTVYRNMPRQTTSEEFQELGRGYYKLKQYQKAIEAFTQGIEISPTPSLYDYRAASYDKLADYNAAVKDGREMIKLDKKDIKGYLRTASVLEKMEKQEVALGIYKYGMKNVPVDDKNFKVRAASHRIGLAIAHSYVYSSSNSSTTRPRANYLPPNPSIPLAFFLSSLRKWCSNTYPSGTR